MPAGVMRAQLTGLIRELFVSLHLHACAGVRILRLRVQCPQALSGRDAAIHDRAVSWIYPAERCCSCLLQEFGIVGYTMNLSMIEYKTLIIREELEAAAQLLPSIPKVCFACP